GVAWPHRWGNRPAIGSADGALSSSSNGDYSTCPQQSALRSCEVRSRAVGFLLKYAAEANRLRLFLSADEIQFEITDRAAVRTGAMHPRPWRYEGSLKPSS